MMDKFIYRFSIVKLECAGIKNLLFGIKTLSTIESLSRHIILKTFLDFMEFLSATFFANYILLRYSFSVAPSSTTPVAFQMSFK